MSTIAVLIARLQMIEINNEIKKTIEELRGKSSRVAIVLGEGKTGSTRQNPFEGDVRRQMIQNHFRDVTVLILEDHPSDEAWSTELDHLLEKEFPSEEIHLYGSKERFVSVYSGRYNATAIGSSHKLRYEKSEPINSEEFRRGAVHALGRTYPKAYPTVDICVFRNNRKEILLGLKPSEKKWRFLGGFVDPSDKSYEDAARRELQEECGISDVSNPAYEGSFLVDDWRYRFEDDKIITTLFSADFISGEPKADDDIGQVEWITLESLSHLMAEGETTREHKPLFELILKKYHS